MYKDEDLQDKREDPECVWVVGAPLCAVNEVPQLVGPYHTVQTQLECTGHWNYQLYDYRIGNAFSPVLVLCLSYDLKCSWPPYKK